MKTQNQVGRMVSFASTAILYEIPRRFDGEQRGLFTIIVAALNEKCFENMEWNGRDEYLEISSAAPEVSVKEVIECVDRLCQLEGARFYGSYLGDKRWFMGLVEKAQTPVEHEKKIVFQEPIALAA